MKEINSKIWEASSSEWVATMNKSKENKEEYRKYVEKTDRPIPYREWLREYERSNK